MGTQETAQAWADAENTLDMDALASILADNFQLSGPVPEPVGAEEFLGLIRVMAAAFSELNFNTTITSVEGNAAKTTNQVTGTHSADLDLSMMGMGVIPATGKSFSLPIENGEVIVEGDKIASIYVTPDPNAGLMGILAQLGIEPPAM